MKDLCIKKGVGYAFSDRINTQLAIDALDRLYAGKAWRKGLFSTSTGVSSMLLPIIVNI